MPSRIKTSSCRYSFQCLLVAYSFWKSSLTAVYLLGKSRRLASENWPNLPENIIQRTKCFAPLFVPVSIGNARSLPMLSQRSCFRWISCVQNRAMWRGVSYPPPHRHIAVLYPGTRRLCKNWASPIRPVRAWTSRALSAFLRSLCSFRIFFVGGVFPGVYPIKKILAVL